MRRLGIAAGCLLAGLTLVLGGAPLLMVMVLIGGQADIEELCGPEPDVALAAGSTDLDQAQLENASAVIAEGRRLEVPERAILVALAVAHQESGFRNYANDGVGGDLEDDQQGIEASMELPHDEVGTDHGSLGVFQQQWPWWGSMPELMDPTTAARKFYSALLEVPGWASMPVTEAGQAVQRSAFPDAYADDVDLASSLLGAGPSADAVGQPAVYYGGMAGGGCSGPRDVTGQVVQPLPASASYVDQANWGNGGAHWESTHTGTDFSAACGTTVRASTDGLVTVRTDQAWSGRWLLQITTPNNGVTTWYAHMQDLLVNSGDRYNCRNCGKVDGMTMKDGRIGVFRARVTRDGEASSRDGQPYFAMNRMAETNRAEGDRDLFEIQFADGIWMLAREDDLVAGVIGDWP